MRATTRNILAIYAQATDDQIWAGKQWYFEANALARELDPDNPERAAGVIAALSPLNQWERNAELARKAYQCGEASGTLGHSVRTANSILAGTPPLDILKGPKVRAFYLAIADPESEEGVVVDRHAFDVAMGKRTDDDTRTRYLKRKGVQESIVGAYKRAAAQLGISPVALQAITWVVWRSVYRYQRT